MFKESVHKHKTYKSFLNAVCGAKGVRRGVRSQLAEASGCTTAYVSQVLNADRDFNLEQAQRIAKFLQLTSSESHYFLLLVQKDRAGTRELREYFRQQLRDLRQARSNVRERLGHTHQLSAKDQSKYYSSWLYGALHIAMSVPALRDREVLAQRWNMPRQKISEALEFLKAAGLLSENYQGGPAHVHLGGDSDLISRHHVNWRVQAMKALDALDARNLHYSAVVSLAREDFERVRETLITCLRDVNTTVAASSEEVLGAFNVDWFLI